MLPLPSSPSDERVSADSDAERRADSAAPPARTRPVPDASAREASGTAATPEDPAGRTALGQLAVQAKSVGPSGGTSTVAGIRTASSIAQEDVQKALQSGRQEEPLSAQVAAGKFRKALEYLNGRSMDGMLDEIEKLGFAGASYLLSNLGAAAWLGPYALARLEAGIRAVGIRQTGSTGELLTPLLDAVTRSGVRQHSDQFDAIRRKVPPPAGGWIALVQQHLAMAEYGEFFALTAADSAFRVLDFVTDTELNSALRGLTEKQLRLLIVSNKMADRYEGERIRRALDATWRARFPLVEPPWPKAVTTAGMNVADMSAMDKLAEAIRRSEKYGGDEIKGKVAELLTPQALAMMVGTTILFAVLEAGTAGAAGVALIALSAVMVGPEVYQIVGDINGFVSTAVSAQDEAALDLAGQYFAKAAVAISIDILVAVLLHKPTKATTPKIQARARAAGEFLKSRVSPPGRPSGELIPALAMAAEGPRFVQAPPERLTPMETRGGGPGAGAGRAQAVLEQNLRRPATPAEVSDYLYFEERYNRERALLPDAPFEGFEEYIYDARCDVNIGLLRGSRAADFAAANRLAGLRETPKGWTWHHHPDLGRMILIPTELHRQYGHWGGVSIWQRITEKPYRD